MMFATWHPTTKPRSHAKAETHEERPIAKTSRVAARKDTVGPEVFAAVWPSKKALVGPLAQEPSMDSARPAVDVTAETPDDMPLIWPVLTAADLAADARSTDVAAGTRSPDAMVMPQHLPLLFVGALALAAVVGRGVAAGAARRLNTPGHFL
jgi:hypothetical protein